MFKLILLGFSIVNAQEKSSDAQTILAKSGITLPQCQFLRDQLPLKSDACNLLETEFQPHIERAKKVVIKARELGLTGDFSVEKMARIFKEFPDTTDQWILDELGLKELKGKGPVKNSK